MRTSIVAAVAAFAFSLPAFAEELNVAPEGFTALFNGKDTTGWKVHEKSKADWSVSDGVLVFDGKGYNLLETEKNYGDFELLVEWKVDAKSDSGLYLRGNPQVQIWDPALNNIGSGGLYNNKKGGNNPLVLADAPIGAWNKFVIKMVGEEVTVHLNGKLVVDKVPLENYFKAGEPLPKTGSIGLQEHNTKVYFRNVFIKEL
ncbi:MAG: 3-keto-disaccharide hydrolase [Planctomycetia bacterium]